MGRFLNADGYASTGQGFLGYNMFAYCGNNPILFQDSLGSLIEIANNATDKEIEQYVKAITYLKTSETAAAIINQLEASDVIIRIEFVYDNNTYYDNTTKTIYFDVYSGMCLSGGRGVQSPALGLLHEMGHALQDINEPLLNVNDPRFSDKYRLGIEQANLIRHEIPVARELNEPVRLIYNSSEGYCYPYRLRSSTQRVLGITRTQRNCSILLE